MKASETGDRDLGEEKSEAKKTEKAGQKLGKRKIWPFLALWRRRDVESAMLSAIWGKGGKETVLVSIETVLFDSSSAENFTVSSTAQLIFAQRLGCSQNRRDLATRLEMKKIPAVEVAGFHQVLHYFWAIPIEIHLEAVCRLIARCVHG